MIWTPMRYPNIVNPHIGGSLQLRRAAVGVQLTTVAGYQARPGPYEFGLIVRV